MTIFARRIQVVAVTAMLIVCVVMLAAEWTHAKGRIEQHHSYLEASVTQLGDRVAPPPLLNAVVEADRRVFRATRSLQGTARWEQAVRDVDQSAPSLLKAFSCPSGLNLTAERAPHLAALLDVAGADGAEVSSRAKTRFRRARPYILDQGPTCAATQSLRDLHDYPSGHSSRGWTWALILAKMLPARREHLLARANAYAESRVICGFHSPTGAGAGRAVAALTVNSLMRNRHFRADLQRAAKELAALKLQRQVPPARQCQSEALSLARVY